MNRFKPGDLVILKADYNCPISPVVIVLRVGREDLRNFMKVLPEDTCWYQKYRFRPATPEDFQKCSEEELMVLLQGKADLRDKENSS